MKKGKRILAATGAVLLAAMYVATLVFAMMDSPWAYTMFRICLYSTILVPVLLYAMILVYRRLRDKNRELFSGNINTVIFDVGNVLVDYDWKSYVKSFGYSEEIEQAAAKGIFEHPLWNETDRGVMTTQELEDGFASHAPAYDKEMRKIFQGAAGTVHAYAYARSWVQELKKRGMKVYILSNYGEKMFAETKDQMEFLPLVDGAVFSYTCHMVKPEKEIYLYLMDKFSINPTHAVFIDDRAENVEAARAVGIRGLQFTSYEDTRNALERILHS